LDFKISVEPLTRYKNKQKMRQLITLWCLTWAIGTSAQFSSLVTNSPDTRPLVVILNQENEGKLITNSINALSETEKKRYHFLMFYGAKPNLSYIEKTLNDLLNKDKAFVFDKRKIYLLVFQSEPALREALSIKSVFADVASTHMTTDQESIDLLPFLNKFAQKRLWEIEVAQLEQRTKKITYRDRRLGIGFMMGQNSQSSFVESDSSYIPSSITKVGLMANYRISNRFQVMGKVMTSFKLPNRSGLQSSIFSQIDLAAGGEQTVTAEIKFHVYVQSSLQLNYIINPQNRLKVVPGIGMSSIFFTSAKSKIEQVIDVSDISSGGGPGALGGGLEPDTDIPRLSKRFMDPYASLGLTYKANKYMDFVFNADYSLSRRSGEVYGVYYSNQPNNPLSLNLGVQFTFGKSRKYFNYLDDKNKE
jgi:hypothetical protein